MDTLFSAKVWTVCYFTNYISVFVYFCLTGLEDSERVDVSHVPAPIRTLINAERLLLLHLECPLVRQDNAFGWVHYNRLNKLLPARLMRSIVCQSCRIRAVFDVEMQEMRNSSKWFFVCGEQLCQESLLQRSLPLQICFSWLLPFISSINDVLSWMSKLVFLLAGGAPYDVLGLARWHLFSVSSKTVGYFADTLQHSLVGYSVMWLTGDCLTVSPVLTCQSH